MLETRLGLCFDRHEFPPSVFSVTLFGDAQSTDSEFPNLFGIISLIASRVTSAPARRLSPISAIVVAYSERSVYGQVAPQFGHKNPQMWV